jgi:hypothetical protein
MSTKDKLIERFRKQPKDFTFDELTRLFGFFGFTIDNKGKTSGSRVLFKSENKTFFAHKPHPESIIKAALMKQVLDYLIENDFISEEE